MRQEQIPLVCKDKLEIIKIFPRGFCAGVDRAIQIVEKALAKFGAPLYVHHDIVHNTSVVADFKAQGVIFVEDIQIVPQGAPIIFSAHGVATCVVETAKGRQLHIIDATCPLVSKVHAQVRHFFAQGIETILIGHHGHPEVIGTLGQVPETWVSLIQTEHDAAQFTPTHPALACVTQTTLSVDEASSIMHILQARFPHLILPAKQDICYATTNRQEAVKLASAQCDIMFVIGSNYSSNSQRLVEVARAAGCSDAFLIDTPDDIPWSHLAGKKCLGVTSGASAPETLLDQVIAQIQAHFTVTMRSLQLRDETVTFKIPKSLTNKN